MRVEFCPLPGLGLFPSVPLVRIGRIVAFEGPKFLRDGRFGGFMVEAFFIGRGSKRGRCYPIE